MDDDLLMAVVRRVLHREFPTRIALAKALGSYSSYVTRIKREVIERGLMDAETWASCFRTRKKLGMRGKDKRKRRSGSGVYKRQAANQRVRQSLETYQSGSLQGGPATVQHPASLF